MVSLSPATDVAQKRADYCCDCYVTLSSTHDYWLRQFAETVARIQREYSYYI